MCGRRNLKDLSVREYEEDLVDEDMGVDNWDFIAQMIEGDASVVSEGDDGWCRFFADDFDEEEMARQRRFQSISVDALRRSRKSTSLAWRNGGVSRNEDDQDTVATFERILEAACVMV